MTRAREVFRFELAYQLGRTSTRVYFAIFFAFALAIDFVLFLDARNDGYFFNAPMVTGLITVIASMLSLVVIAGVAGDAATRDAQLRIDSLLFTTPLRRASWLGGRFLGAFAVSALLLVAVPLALLAATRLPGAGSEVIGPFRAGAYLTSYFALALPNAFVATAVLFAVAVLSRRAIGAYAGAGALFFSTLVAQGFIAGRLGNWSLARLLDPLGYTTLIARWRSYNPLQKNTRPIELDAALFHNRLFWLAVALGVLTLALLRFRVAYESGSRSRRAMNGEDIPSPRPIAIAVPAARRSFGIRARVHQLLAIAFDSLRDLHKSRGWWIVPFTAVLFVATAAELLQVELGTPGAATTARVAAIFGGDELARLVAILIALSAGELIWRERNARIHAIAGVTPVPEWVSFSGRFLALALMLVTTELIFLGACVATQVMRGHFDFQFGVYLQFLFGFQLTGYLLFAALAMLIHVAVNQKYAANVLAILAYFGVQMARELGVEHNLLLYGSAPEPVYTEMGGFGAQIGPWSWFALYWSGWALLFAVVTYLLWMHGEESGLRRRLALARRRFTQWPATIAIAAVAIIAGAGSFVFYNTNVLNRYRTAADLEQRAVDYERRYGQYASVAQPALAATKLQVEFYPERRAATIRGTYALENRSGRAVEAIHVVVNPEVETTNVAFDRASRLTMNDDDLGYRIYALDEAVQPGESLRMTFDLVHAPRGFTNHGWNPSVIANGSWFQHRADQNHSERQWLPFVGYQRNRELHNESARKRYKLPARPAVAPLDDLAARHRQMGREQIALETIIGTDANQTGVAPGRLVRHWSENGRHHTHYVTDAPVSNIYAIYSAHYAVQRARWNDVEIEVLHHPPHTRNLQRMLASVRASLDYHTRHYGQYPHKQLRLVQYPSSGAGLGLTSFPGLIEYSDGYALTRVEDDPRGIDLPFAVMAHEIGHQWWGHQLVPAPVEGAPLLTESLAWYSAMMTVEKARGRDQLTRLLDAMRAEYLAPHQTRDVPLLRMRDRLDAYRTGPFAMYAVREATGETAVNAALRHLLARFHPARPPYAASLDLYHELRAATPPARHALLKDLFEEITFWDLRTKGLDVQPAPGGTYRVTLHIEAQKLRGDALGRETPVPMNDLIDIAVFDAAGKTIHRAPHRIRSGEQTITLTVPRRPASAGIDPDHVLMDRKVEDNVSR